MEKRHSCSSLSVGRARVWVALLLVWVSVSTYAQVSSPGSLLQGGAAANFRFAEPGELTITVSLLGAVRSPGRYEISRTTDLMDLLALAGGWLETADLSDVRVSTAKTSGDKHERLEIRLDLGDFSKVVPIYLTLQHGDMVYIGTQSSVTIERVLAWVSTVATLTTLYFTIQNNR